MARPTAGCVSAHRSQANVKGMCSREYKACLEGVSREFLKGGLSREAFK